MPADEAVVELGGCALRVERTAGAWTTTLPRSLVRVRDLAELDLLEHDHDLLLPCRVAVDDDQVTLRLAVPAGTRTWADVGRLPRTDRLRALVNVAACTSLPARGIAAVLHPENIVVDRNLRPRLAYRGLVGTMPPSGADERHLLRQYQALVLSTLDPRAAFSELLDGAAVVRRSTELERRITGASSVDELAELLATLHDEAAAVEAASVTRVARRTHLALRHATVWLAVATLGLAAVAGYEVFVRAPFDTRMLEADRRFMALDHEGVIETLRPVPEDRLPLTQRYALAVSYLQGAGLSEGQRTVVENGLSLSSEPDFLTYWVHVGRGDLDEALDRGKALDDVDLILYALALLQEDARSDTTSRTGREREALLDELEAEYDRYLAVREAAVADGSQEPGSGPELDGADVEAGS